jgi:hypothetical protein
LLLVVNCCCWVLLVVVCCLMAGTTFNAYSPFSCFISLDFDELQGKCVF